MFFGRRLKDLRLERGLTQQQLGNMINVTKVSISCYENNIRTPNLETFLDLVNVLDVSADYLLGNDFKVVAEDELDYSIKLSKNDLLIINEIKKNQKLYQNLINNPKRIIDLINKRINL
jgi:transcriptional regulator with XRE-family HTH domain